MSGAYSYEFDVPVSAIDANGHVNNVEFLCWMLDAAIGHADSTGCTVATRDAGATWVVRSHRIDYLRPAVAGDRVKVLTWVADFRRAFSLRKYKFVRCADDVVLARGETDWVFVDVKTGRPRSVPEHILGMFQILADEPQG